MQTTYLLALSLGGDSVQASTRVGVGVESLLRSFRIGHGPEIFKLQDPAPPWDGRLSGEVKELGYRGHGDGRRGFGRLEQLLQGSPWSPSVAWSNPVKASPLLCSQPTAP